MTKRKTTAAKDTQPDIGTIEREVGTLVADLASTRVAVNSLHIRLAAAEQAISALNERPRRFAFLRRLFGARR